MLPQESSIRALGEAGADASELGLAKWLAQLAARDRFNERAIDPVVFHVCAEFIPTQPIHDHCRVLQFELSLDSCLSCMECFACI